MRIVSSIRRTARWNSSHHEVLPLWRAVKSSDGLGREVSRRRAASRSALPLSTATRMNRWRVAIGDVAGKEAIAVLSQLRNLDSVLLCAELGRVDPEIVMRLNFG